MSSFTSLSSKLACSRCIALAVSAVALFLGSRAEAVVLEPSNVFASSYHTLLQNGVGLPATRQNTFNLLTNGIVDHVGTVDRLDTFDEDHVNTLPGHTVFDFVGLQYATPQRFDSVTVELGMQFGDGGDWEALPKVYILRNPTLVGDQVEPNLSGNWFEVSGAVETTGHVFSPLAAPFGTAGGTIRFDLSAVPVADRTGWGWAVGGVDGNANAAGNFNFISLTEVYAEGAPAPVPHKEIPTTLKPVGVVSNAYHSVAIGDDLVGDRRAIALKSLVNGIIDRVNNNGDGFDTWHGDGAGVFTDFVGLQYASLNVFDSVTIELGRQFGDGGDWDAKPKVYILKNPIDTNTSAPENDPANWLELDAPETTGHVFDPLTLPAGTPGGTIRLDLSAFSEQDRTGWGIAVGGVDGNSSDAGVVNFISVTEMSVVGTVIPGPYELSLQVNTTTGEVKLMNNTNLDVNLDYYEITSESGALDLTASGWNSLQNPTLNTPAFPSGDGSGNGWEELGNLDEHLAAEFFLQGSTEMENGTSVSLGNLFAGGTQDLFFRYGIGGAFIDGVVEYLSGPGLLGDFNNDGSVDAADYLVWRNNVGSSDSVLGGNGAGTGTVDGDDYQLWKSRYGQQAGALASEINPVPEPGSLLLGSLLAALGLFAVRQNR